MAALVEVLNKIPAVTRTLLGLSLAVTGPVSLSLINPYYILFSTRHIVQKLELWRIVTPFFFLGSGIQVLFDLFLLYRNSTGLETELFRSRTADYAWTMICLMGAILATNYPLNSVIFCGPLMSALGFMWSQINPDALVSLFGLPPFKASYYPFAMLALDYVRGGKALAAQSLSGVVAGWMVHHLGHVYPATHGGQRPWFMYPPAFLSRLLDGPPQTAGGPRPAPAFAPRPRHNHPRPPPASTTAHTWGTGNRLG